MGNDYLEQKAKGGFMGCKFQYYEPLVVHRYLWDEACKMSVTNKRSMKQQILLLLQAFGFSLHAARFIVSIVGYNEALTVVRSTRTIIQHLVYRGVTPYDAAKVVGWVLAAGGMSRERNAALVAFISSSIPEQSKQWLCTRFIAEALLTDDGKQALGCHILSRQRYEKKPLQIPRRLSRDSVAIVKLIFKRNIAYNNHWSQLSSPFLHRLVMGNCLLLKGAKAEWIRTGDRGVQDTLERVLDTIGHSGFAAVHGQYWDNVETAIRLAEEDWHQVVP